jgi:DNA polymerase-1
MNGNRNGCTWVVDFEFQAPAGHRPKVWCGVFHCLETGETRRLVFNNPGPHPNPLGPEDTLVAFFASAELTSYLSLGWELPAHVIDLYAEAKVILGAEQPPGLQGWGLLDVARYFGVTVSLDAEKKTYFRDIAIRGPVTDAEWQELVTYCEEDVVTTTELYKRIGHRIHLGQARLRGLYWAAVSHMEHNGIPLDLRTWARLKRHWAKLLDRQTAKVNQDWPVYRQDKKGKWSRNLAAWVEVMAQKEIPWPRTACGRPSTSEDTMKEMANRYPELRPLRELESSRGQFRLGLSLAVGPDGRNRCLLSPFKTVTGRGAPSNAAFVFGPSCWIRSLIQAQRGMAVIYSDLSSAEIGIAGALSGDSTLVADYQGDPYLAFARAAGLVPDWATKKTHEPERDLAKRVLLGINYGMGQKGLAKSLGVSEARAGQLLAIHKARYHVFWEWVADVQVQVSVGLPLQTKFGWTWKPPRDGNGRLEFNPRRAQNWLPQSMCGEILRLASVYLVAQGVKVLAPIHDALLVEGTVDQAEALADIVRQAWHDAAVAVIGIPLKADTKILRPGERYVDNRGVETWASVMELLDTLDQEEAEALLKAEDLDGVDLGRLNELNATYPGRGLFDALAEKEGL